MMGVVIRSILFGIALGAFIYLIATNLWWTGAGYCWGDVTKCLLP